MNDQEVLEQRARALARPAEAAPAADGLEVVTFALAGETYAIESRYVGAVLRLTELSPLPGADSPVYGVVPFRGGLLTILDLRPVLGVSTADLTDLARLIVVGQEAPAFGLLADAVHQIVRLPASGVSPPPEGVAARRDYLRGVTTDAVLVLDGACLLRLAE